MTYKYTKLRIAQFIFIIMLLFIAVEAGWCEKRYTKHDFLGYYCITRNASVATTICNPGSDCIVSVVTMPVRECEMFLRQNTAPRRECRMPEVTVGSDPYEGMSFREPIGR